MLKEAAKTADLIVAADGGVNTARTAGVTPDVIIGDLDSAAPTARRKFKNASWVFVDNQDNTDLEKALNFLIETGCKRCTLLGFLGGRADFSIGNILTLVRYASRIQLCVADENWQLFPLTGRQTFTARTGARVSLIPLTPCQGVCVTGLQFPLKNARLVLGTTRTLSNRTTRSHFTVSLSRGTLLVCLEN